MKEGKEENSCYEEKKFATLMFFYKNVILNKLINAFICLTKSESATYTLVKIMAYKNVLSYSLYLINIYRT